MPNESHPESLVFHFSVIEDPRIERTKDHLLIDILTIALCAMLCGAEGRGGGVRDKWRQENGRA